MPSRDNSRELTPKSPHYRTQTTTTCRTILSDATLRICGNSARLRRWSNTTTTPKKSTGLNLDRVNVVLRNDPEIEKIRGIVEVGAVIDTAPEFRPIHRTAPFRNLQLRMLPVYKKAVADMHAKNKVLIFRYPTTRLRQNAHGK